MWGADGFRFEGSVLAEVVGDRDYAAHREELRLPVLQGPVPDVSRSCVAEKRDRGLVRFGLFRVVDDGAGDCLRRQGEYEDGSHGDQERGRAELQRRVCPSMAERRYVAPLAVEPALNLLQDRTVAGTRLIAPVLTSRDSVAPRLMNKDHQRLPAG